MTTGWEIAIGIAGIAIGVGGISATMFGFLLKSSGELAEKIDTLPEVMLETFDRICHERQGHCASLVLKDVNANSKGIEEIKGERRRCWDSHLRKYHFRYPGQKNGVPIDEQE